MAAFGWEIDLFVPMPTRGVDNKTRRKYKKNKLELKYDLSLIHILSLWLDIRIFLRTLITVLMRKDVFVTVNKEKRSNISI